jgi:hypothetical protein
MIDDSDIKELSGIPSVDMRPVLEIASKPTSSNQLRDTMLTSRLATAEEKANWEKHPWDNKAYKRCNELTGNHRTIPAHTPGNSINMYAPSKHRLFVKYCRQCVGVMTLVYDWNEDVAEAFLNKIEAKTNEELRRVIRNLNEFIVEQSAKYEQLLADHQKLKKGSQWFTNWKETSSYNTDVELKAKRFR